MTASMNVANGLNADTSRFTVTNSMEPVKMNALMHIGHKKEKPRVPINTPYDKARRKKVMQTGDVLGKAVLKALPMIAFLPCVCETKCPSFQIFISSYADVHRHAGHRTIVFPDKCP